MKKAIGAAAVGLLLSGCASIFSGSTQTVTVNSEPVGAAVTVTNSAGAKVHSGTTPATFQLARGAGYFRAESYTIKLQKDGFAAKEINVTGNINGWYFGNILIGGLIGMLAVDPLTGAMYSFPDNVSAQLEKDAPKAAQAPGSLTLVSTESLSPEVMKQARLVAAF
jgi:uncharacterized protein YceK